MQWSFGDAPLDVAALGLSPLVVSDFVSGVLQRRAPRQDFNIAVRIDGASLLPELIREGVGYYVGPPTMVWEFLQTREFRGSPLSDLRFTREVISRKDRPRSPAATLFVSDSQSAIEKFATSPASPIAQTAKRIL